MNAYGRHRPSEVDGAFNIRTDYGSSIMLRSRWDRLTFYGELAEQNTEIEDIRGSMDKTRSVIAQQHTVGISWNWDYATMALFSKRAMANKLEGIAEEIYGFQVSIKLEKDSTHPQVLRSHQNSPFDQGKKSRRLDQLLHEITLVLNHMQKGFRGF